MYENDWDSDWTPGSESDLLWECNICGCWSDTQLLLENLYNAEEDVILRDGDGMDWVRCPICTLSYHVFCWENKKKESPVSNAIHFQCCKILILYVHV